MNNLRNVNLSETAPTQFQDIGGVSLAYRHFGKEGAPPKAPGSAGGWLLALAAGSAPGPFGAFCKVVGVFC